MTANFHEIKKGKKDSIANFIIDRHRENRDEMQDTRKSWLINLAWVRGKQNYTYDNRIKKFVKSAQDPWRSRLQTNRMLPIVRRNVARLSPAGNIWDVIPATPDEEDIQIARTATGILQNAWQLLNMPIKLIQAAFWQEIVSSCFIKIGWDAEAGGDLQVDSSNVDEDLLTEFMERSGFTSRPDTLKLKTGQAFIDVVPPFYITMDPTVSIFEETDYVIETRLRSRDWIVEKFGNKWKKLNESETTELFLYPGMYSQDEQRKLKGVITHEFIVKKNNKFPDGHYSLITDTREFLIPPKPLPFAHGELPYAHMVSIFDPASVWGTCESEQMRANQARYNMMRGAVVDHIRLMGKVQWLNPKQSGIKQFTNRPGEPYHYNAPFEPKQLQPKPLPGYITEEMNREIADIQDVTSTHDVTQGKAEPGIRSGTAVRSLQDADDAVQGPKLLWFDHQLQIIGRLLLQTIAQYTTEEKVLQIRGEFNELETLTFTGQDLIGKSTNADYWKVRVKTFGRQALTRSGREQLTRTLLELGLMDPQRDKDLLIHILGTSDVISTFDETEIDRTRQWKEIQAIQQNKPVQVIAGEDHDTHIRMIKKFLSSSKRDKMQPEHLLKLVEHLDQHMQMRAAELAKEQSYLQNALVAQGVQPSGPAK